MHVAGVRIDRLRRRWWVVGAAALAAAAVAVVVQPQQSPRYVSESLLLVRSGASPNTPGAATEANRLAVTYSQLIPQDTQVIDRVSRATGVPTRDVEDAVRVVNDPNTSILRVRYVATSSNAAIDGARAVADALAGPTPASPNFNGVGLSRLPDRASKAGGAGSAAPGGLLVGALLGAGLLVAAERFDRRADRADDLASMLRCPVSSLGELTAGSAVAILQRWRALAHDVPAQVAIVPVVAGKQAVSADVVEVLANAASQDPVASGPGERSLAGLALVSTGAPGPAEGGESHAQHADLTVLVVPQGTLVADLRRSLDVLADFGVQPVWALFAEASAMRHAERRSGDATVVAIEIGSAVAPSWS